MLIDVEWAARRLAHLVPGQPAPTKAAYRPFLNGRVGEPGQRWGALAYNKEWKTRMLPTSFYRSYTRRTAKWLLAIQEEFANPQPSPQPSPPPSPPQHCLGLLQSYLKL